MLIRSSSCALFALALCCGGSSTQAPSPASAGPALSREPADPPAASPEKKKVDAEQPKKEFGETCLKQTKGATDYCDCAWLQVKKVLGEDLSKKDDAESSARVRDAVAHECKAKAPESMVKDGYMTGCAGDRAEMQGYCTCTWDEFRKRLSAVEMSDENIVKGERFATTRKQVIKTCGPKMPESVAKDDFLKGCAKDPSANDFCACAWKETRKLGSPAEIEAGMVDQQKLAAQIQAGCAKLRPQEEGGAKKDDKMDRGRK